jgi:predicted metal-dependent phosphoesterase TrpH
MAGSAGPPASDQRLFADLHCHTSASFDSLSRPADVVRAAAARGLTHLAITDHERLDGALAARDLAPPELRLIIGQEVRTRSGDLIGLYLERPVPPGLAAVDAAQAIREQGGVVGLAHPFDRFRASGGRRLDGDEWSALLALVDYVEAYNARLMVGDGNIRAAELAHQRGLAAAAVSDAHTVMEVGVAYTILHGDLDTADGLRAALADGTDLVMGRASRLVRLGMPLFKGVQWLRGNRRVQPTAAGG